MKKISVIAFLMFELCLVCVAQDKGYLAKVEFEMAEEAMTAKKYKEVSEHLYKAIEFLGESNFKIDYLLLYSIYDFVQNSNGTQADKNEWCLNLYGKTQKFLVDYAKTENKDKYADVYRWQTEIEPKVKELRKEFIFWYGIRRSHNRALDSLKFFGKTNWLEEKRGLDSIWSLGRTFDAIAGHYRNAVIKKLNFSKVPITRSKNEFKSYIYLYTHYLISSGFIIENLNHFLPDGEITRYGKVLVPVTAWFNSSNRLFAIKYVHLKKTHEHFSIPLENARLFGSGPVWQRYITGKSYILEYFENERESGLYLILPHDRLEGADEDGKQWTSLSANRIEDFAVENRNYFRQVYGYNPGINIQVVDAPGTNKGCLISSVISGGRAEAAGLRQDDIVTRIGYGKIRSAKDLLDAVFMYYPGEKVEVVYLRNNQEMTTQVVVGKL